MDDPDSSDVAEDPVLARLFPLGWIERAWFTWVTVLTPTFSFGLSALGLHLVDWKDPSPETWPALFLDTDGTAPFLPLAVLVIAVCLGIAVRPGPWVFAFPVRLVLLLGSLLAIQYGAISLAYFAYRIEGGALAPVVLVMALFVLIAQLSTHGLQILGRVIRRFERRFGDGSSVGLGYAISGLAWLGSSLWLLVGSGGHSLISAVAWAPVTIMGVLALASLIVGPVWSCLALFRLQRHLGPFGRPSAGQLSMGAVGLAAYVASWRLSFLAVLESWEALPDQAPNCFVATAAARGPARLVGGERVPAAEGGWQQITPQLQRLKLFELLLMALAPRVHGRLRRVYDRVGPRIASEIRGPGRAAFAWLLLKPAEGLASGALRVVLGAEAETCRRRLYRRGGARGTSTTRTTRRSRGGSSRGCFPRQSPG